MLQTLEIFFLQFVYWFYYLPKSVGLLTLGAAGLTLIVLQFTRGSKSFWFGSIGLFFAAAEVLHFQNPDAVTNKIQLIFDWMAVVHQDRLPVPLFEPIFHYAVAPFYRRTVVEEAFFLTLLTYAISVGFNAREEFKKTGMVFGEFGFFGDWSKKKQHRPNRSQFNELLTKLYK